MANINNITDPLYTQEKGQPNGVATLDSGGKVPITQLPNSIMEYKGTWNAATNTPTLADGVGNTGDVYRVTADGTQFTPPITFNAGDYCIYNGTKWEKSDGTDAVNSVNGYTGNVVLTTSDVAEGTNLYYTNTRSRASLSGGTGISYNSTTGVITSTGAPASGSANYIQNQTASLQSAAFAVSNASRIEGGLSIGMGALPSYPLQVVSAGGISAQFLGRVIGADALNFNELATLAQVNAVPTIYTSDATISTNRTVGINSGNTLRFTSGSVFTDLTSTSIQSIVGAVDGSQSNLVLNTLSASLTRTKSNLSSGVQVNEGSIFLTSTNSTASTGVVLAVNSDGTIQVSNPSFVVRNTIFADGRVSGSNAVNSNEFITLSQQPWTISGTTIYNNNSGAVGIGTNSPTSGTKLHTVGAVYNQGQLSIQGAVTMAVNGSLIFYTGTGNTTGNMFWRTSTGGNGATITFGDDSSITYNATGGNSFNSPVKLNSGLRLVSTGVSPLTGTATFAAGTTSVAVSTQAITANSIIILSIQSYSGSTTDILAAPYIISKTVASGFTIGWAASAGAQSGTVSWIIIEKF